MNELGAGRFDLYDDSDGTALRGPEIGAWDGVPAARAAFVSGSGRVIRARAGGRRDAAARPGAHRRPTGVGGIRLLLARPAVQPTTVRVDLRPERTA